MSDWSDGQGPTVGRTPGQLEAILKRGINVKDPAYGAVGDGTTDDSAAIQGALSALPASGGMVYFPTGRYLCQEPLALVDKPAVQLVGEGARHTAEYLLPGTGVLGGAVLVAGTPGMTLLSLSATTFRSTHSGPYLDHLHFEDTAVGTLGGNLVGATTVANVATFTSPTAHNLVPGDSVYIQNATPVAYFGVWTVIATPTTTTFTANIGSTPAAMTGGRYALDTLRGSLVPTSTLVKISNMVRWNANRCTFYGGLVGLQPDASAAGADVSWGRVEACSFVFNTKGLYVPNPGSGGATSLVVAGGDFTVTTGSIGIDYAGGTNFKVVDYPKFDVGPPMSGTGAIGIKIRKADSFVVEACVEMMYGTGIEVGATGLANGEIRAQVQGNGPVTGRVGTGISMNGTDQTGGCVQGVTISGSTFTGNGVNDCIHLGPNVKGCTIIGGGVYRANRGIWLESGSTRNNMVSFVNSGMTSGYTHIQDDNGVGTTNQVLFNHDAQTGPSTLPVYPESLIQAATSTTTVANTATETVVATYTVGASSPAAGTVFRLRGWGQTDNIVTSGILTFRLRLGGLAGTLLATFALPSVAGALTNQGWIYDAELIYRTIGATADVTGVGSLVARRGSTAGPGSDVQSPITTNSTIAKDLVLTVQHATADVANVVRCDGANFYRFS